MAIDPSKIVLTPEQQALIAIKSEETGQPVAELIDEILRQIAAKTPKRKPREGRSFLDVLKERGLLGAMQGPSDLSTNPVHMEGFGESNASPNSH